MLYKKEGRECVNNEINSDHINKDEDVHNAYIQKFLSSPSPLQQYNQLPKLSGRALKKKVKTLHMGY